MTFWRLSTAFLLLLVIAWPAALPFLALVNEPASWQALAEWPRLLSLAANTLVLVAGTLGLAMPVGIAGAILFYRTDLPLRRFLRFLTLLTLFVPLPLFTSAWQTALGVGGWLPVAVWSPTSPPGAFARPWAEGLGAAIWTNAVAALPWVIVLVGQGLSWVERELEEDALQVASPWRVLWVVTLRRSRAAIVAAAIWVALLAATEITVTDVMQVRTFAEEVYTQFVAGDSGGLTQAVVASIPLVALTWIVVLFATRSWERNLPPLETLATAPRLVELGTARGPVLFVVLSITCVLVGVPVVSLVWKAGITGSPASWSAHTVLYHVSKAFHVHGWLVAESLAIAAVTGVLAAVLGVVACWLALGAGWFQAGVLGLMAAVWALPGPIIGLGLKDAILRLIELPGSRLLADMLYYGPSPVPIVWADLIRFFACAVAILWPVVRLLPREIRDAAAVDGLLPYQELARVVLPLTWPLCLRAGLAVAVLSLGELSAGKLAETPGSHTFAHQVFTQMHYGVTNDLAALCLVLLVIVLAGGCLVALSTRSRRARR